MKAISILRMIPMGMVLVFVLAAVGCQTEKHTSQAVNLRVTDKASGQPLSGATVTILRGKGDVRNSKRPSDSAAVGDKKDLPTGKTDVDGNVRVIVDDAFFSTDLTAGVITEVDSSTVTAGSKDRLTGTVRRVEVTKGEASETLRVKMTPGSAAQGEELQIFVQSIGKPMATAHGKGPG